MRRSSGRRREILKKHVATDEFVHRFEREVQLASQLRHPNTVEIYDFGRTAMGSHTT